MTSRSLSTCVCIAIAALTTARSASAEQHCVSTSVPDQPINWITVVDLPRFDASLGQLESVQVFLTGSASGAIRIENLATYPGTFVDTFSARLTIQRPDATVLVQVDPSVAFIDNLSAFDGTIDFDGPSGETHSSMIATQSHYISTNGASDRALFTGPAGNPGTVPLTVSANGTASSSGSGNVFFSYTQTAAAPQVQVCYHYTNSGSTFCSGDGGVSACPCGNSGQYQHGCANSLFSSGALLGATGTASVASDTLVLGAIAMPNAQALYFQGTATAAGSVGFPFGDGIRCVGGTVIRLGIKSNVAGASSYPQSGDAPISIRGLVHVGGGARYYQVWYRNVAAFCTFDGFNLTNGISIVWSS